ncbi:MAG: glycoside hydrolase family 2 TIM barrel-domain containing protein [Candidatus Omnitrophota bacterium]
MMHIKKILLSLGCVALFLTALEASEVYVRGQKGSWYLEVDGKPFYIKGAGCGLAIGRCGEDYLKLAKELGANSVRTWGTDQGTKQYLDKAERYGLKVAAGIWLNNLTDDGKFSYIHDEEYKTAKRSEIFEYVREYKDHPAILMWVIGNEAIFFTKDEKEKIALSKFLESVIKEVHQIDPRHPICYASASKEDLPYLAKYVPSLDIAGMNEYGSIRTAHGAWDYLQFNIPYVFTEYGPYLSIDRPKDANAKPMELTDTQKAKKYKEFIEQIIFFKGYNLGGFVFHLGETTQESMTWWNINERGAKRASFWMIYEFYAGQKAPCVPVKIESLTLSKQKNISLGELIEVEVSTDSPGREGLTFEYAVSSAKENILQYYVNEYEEIEVFGAGPQVRLKAPLKQGVYRLYCFIKDKEGNVTSQNKSISVE